MPLLTFIVQIIIYSLLPLLGVFFFGWDWRQILILFWLENITIGIKAIIGMARSSNPSIDTVHLDASPGININSQIVKVGGIAFFIFHYGMFTLIHGIFVSVLVSGIFLTPSAVHTESSVDIFALLSLWAIASAVQIFRSIVQPAPTSTITRQFSEPYKRIIPLHVAIVLGAFAMIVFNLPSSAAIILIVIKLFFDVKNYRSILNTTDLVEATV